MYQRKQISRFTLTELLVVVAILGILSAVGITSYNGYVRSAERNAAQNLMQQISLGQSEFFSDEGSFFSAVDNECNPSNVTLRDIYMNLLGSTTNAGAMQRAEDSRYKICISADEEGSTDYLITASNRTTTTLTLNSEGELTSEEITP